MYAYYDNNRNTIVIDVEDTPLHMITLFNVVSVVCNSIDFTADIAEDYLVCLGNDCAVAEIEVSIGVDDYYVYIGDGEIKRLLVDGHVELILFNAYE